MILRKGVDLQIYSFFASKGLKFLVFLASVHFLFISPWCDAEFFLEHSNKIGTVGKA